MTTTGFSVPKAHAGQEMLSTYYANLIDLRVCDESSSDSEEVFPRLSSPAGIFRRPVRWMCHRHELSKGSMIQGGPAPVQRPRAVVQPGQHLSTRTPAVSAGAASARPPEVWADAAAYASDVRCNSCATGAS